jgi:hypothetical protein
MEEGQALVIASRSGAMLALCFFMLVFGGIAWALVGSLRNRGVSQNVGTLVFLTLFTVPVTLIYASSLHGFYEVEARASGIRLTYLLPALSTYIDRAAVTRVEAQPAARGQWRVHVLMATGEERSSAPASQSVAADVADALRAQLVPAALVRPPAQVPQVQAPR